MLVHDVEKLRSALDDRLGLTSERHNVAALRSMFRSGQPARPCERCLLLREEVPLGDMPQVPPGHIPQRNLDLFSIATNDPDDKTGKAAMLQDRAMRCPKRYGLGSSTASSLGQRGQSRAHRQTTRGF